MVEYNADYEKHAYFIIKDYTVEEITLLELYGMNIGWKSVLCQREACLNAGNVSAVKVCSYAAIISSSHQT